MADALILVSNPGSASRKYALFEGDKLRANLHFELVDSNIVCSLVKSGKKAEISVRIDHIDSAAGSVLDILQERGLIEPHEHIARIGVRVVAPGTYFAHHRIVNQHFIDTLQRARQHAPLHITATLEEMKALHHKFPETTMLGISDSAFHASRPNFSQYYSIPKADAEKLDIKRFGYHGLAVESVVQQLHKLGKLTPRLVIVHLGGGASVTAVYRGKSLDNTMGYSPLEGLTMATRSGSIDFTAIRALKDGLKLDDDEVEEYLNKQSGLLGLGGSSDLREILAHQEEDERAKLALQTYIFNIQKAIGQMAGALGGLDQLVFTGTVGERNSHIRQLIADKLHYLDILLSAKVNRTCSQPSTPVLISKHLRSKPVFIVPANENAVIASHTLQL